MLIFFLFSFFTSCTLFYYCPEDDSKNLGSNLKFGTYSRESKGYVTEGIEILDEKNVSHYIQGKEILSLHEDSTFTYFAIANNESNDTVIKILNGNFKIYQDPGFSWYAFKFKSDSVHRRQKIGFQTECCTPSVLYYKDSTFKFKYTDFIGKYTENINYNYIASIIGSGENFLSDIDDKSNCFTLAYKVESKSDNPEIRSCDKTVLKEIKTFCLEQPKTSQPNSTGDSL
jgi:hypothetical protein